MRGSFENPLNNGGKKPKASGGCPVSSAARYQQDNPQDLTAFAPFNKGESLVSLPCGAGQRHGKLSRRVSNSGLFLMTLSKVAGVSGLCLMCFSVSVVPGRTQHQSAQRADLPRSPGLDRRKQIQEKEVYSIEDLNRSKQKSHSNGVESAPNKKGSKGNKSAPRESGSSAALTRYRDLNGHNREYWQKRIKPLKTNLERLDSQINTLQKQHDSETPLSGIKISRRGRWRARPQETRNTTSRKIDGLKQKRAEVVKSIQEVEEEGRKAQALPEWLR